MSPRVAWEGAPRAPRRWQAEALPVLQEALRARKRPIIQAATGSGKSVLISEACWLTMPKAQAQRRPIVVGVPSQNLVRQFAPTIAQRCGAANVGMYYADRKEADRPIIVVCYPSLPQLAVDLALAQDTPEPLLMVCDEVHKTEAERVLAGVQALRPKALCGFTATPFRSDSAQSISLFTDLIFQYTMGQAIRDGVLVRDEWRWDVQGGDINDQTMRMIQAELFPGGVYLGPGVVSAVSIADAEEFAQSLRVWGFEAEAIHSKLPAAEQRRRIEDLRQGRLKAVVHCSMLAEGVDYPWLRWIALRRPVGSAVRFVQEAGRVLRSDPENPAKTYGLILDPHNIWGELGLKHDPAIGSADSLETAMAEDGRSAAEGPAERQPLPPGKAVELATQWTQRLAMALEAEGITNPQPSSRRWRSSPCTERQVQAIQGAPGQGKGLVRMTRYLPKHAKEPIKLLCEMAHTLQSGACSDLIDVLLGIAAQTKPEREWYARGQQGERPVGWRWPEDVVIPELRPDACAGLKASKAEVAA